MPVLKNSIKVIHLLFSICIIGWGAAIKHYGDQLDIHTCDTNKMPLKMVNVFFGFNLVIGIMHFACVILNFVCWDMDDNEDIFEGISQGIWAIAAVIHGIASIIFIIIICLKQPIAI